MMASVLEFVAAPSEVFMNSCTKEELLQMADHYEIRVADKKRKDEVKCVILSASEMAALRVYTSCKCKAILAFI